MKSALLLFAAGLLGLSACSKAESTESQGGLTLEAKLPTSFGQLSNVVELDTGRVAFADTREKLFLAAAFASGKLDTLGTRVEAIKKDAAPGEYKFPGWVARLAGDTVALVDFSAMRTTLWSTAGKPLRVLSLGGSGGHHAGAGVRHRGARLQDRLPGHAGSAARRSQAAGQHSGTADPSGEGQGGHGRPPGGAGVRRGQVRGAGAAGGDGLRPERLLRRAGQRQRLGRARPGEPGGLAGGRRHLERRPTSRKFTGQPVTQADKDRVLAQVREQGKQYGMPQELTIEYPFAATKPPFDFALGRPNGEVWLQRPRAAGERAAGLRRVRPEGRVAAGGDVPRGCDAGGVRSQRGDLRVDQER